MGSKHRSHVITVFMAIALACAAAAPGACAENIIVAGQVVARITARGEFASAAQRAARIDQRITQAISVENVGQPRMSVRPGAGVPTIFVGNTMLMRVYEEDAARYGLSPEQVAAQWSANLVRQFPLAEPCIRMGRASAADELSRAQARTAAAADVSVPPQDWAIVAVVLEHLAHGRAQSAPVFEQEQAGLVAQVCGDIARHAALAQERRALVTPPHAPGRCPQAGGCPACLAARRAALGIDADGEERAGASQEVPSVAARRIEAGLRLMRSVDDERYLRDRVMVAWTIVKVVRKECGA